VSASGRVKRLFRFALVFGVSLFFLAVLSGGMRLTRHLSSLESLLSAHSAVEAGYPPETSPALLPIPQDFDERCKSPGVLVCQGFDSAADFLPPKWPADGLYPAWDKAIHGQRDTNVKASGQSSLKLEILSNSGPNVAGFWRQSFEHNFGPGTTFYIEFRQRFSKEMLTNQWGDTAWKQVIFHNESTTCGQVELTTAQYHSMGIPIMYTDCGSKALYWDTGQPPLLLEQGDYNCVFEHVDQKNCFHYQADQWITFYYQVSVGRWGKPESTINAWAALEGQRFRQWVKMSHFILKNDHPGNDYDTLTLLAYMTNKDMKINHPTAYTWFDELIVSKEPIALPK
jgi:hypothetical protein